MATPPVILIIAPTMLVIAVILFDVAGVMQSSCLT